MKAMQTPASRHGNFVKIDKINPKNEKNQKKLLQVPIEPTLLPIRKVSSTFANLLLMTQFTSEQSDVFNKVRYKSERRKKIADEIAKRRVKIEKYHKKMLGLAGKIVQEQIEVVEKQTKVAQEQAEIAQEQAEIAQEQAEIVYVQEEIQELNGEISKLSALDAGLQADVTVSLDRLDQYGAMKPVLLDFSHNTIFWGENGHITLAEKQYSIVKVLYFAEQHMMEIASLEEKVWGTNKLPTDNNARVTISTLNSALKAANCPYEVIRTKQSLKTVPVENPVTKGVMEVVVQPKIEVYELVCRE